VLDDHLSDDRDHRSGGGPVSLDSLARRVPGAAASAPKRNVLVALGYLLVSGLAAELLLTAL
jgi:hypothetical protein